jgi:radical SAM protein with 4Fe4S-binding SPASM domain
VSVSIDGLAETHDLQRGVQGSFAAARAALGHLRAAGVDASANTQINRLSFPELDDVLDLIAAEGARAWQVQLTVPMGRAADRPEWLLQPYDLLHVMPKIEELSIRARSLGVRLWPGNNIGYFGPHEDGLQRGVDAGAHTTGCAAGKYVLGIEADGAIKGCPSLPTAAYTGGNVREKSIKQIWDETRELRFARDRVEGDLDELWGFCRSCYYAEVCRAGCTWTAHVTLGRKGNNPYCHHRALEHQRRGLRERLVHVEAAPGDPFDHGRFEIVVEDAAAEEPARRRLAVLIP